MGIRFLRYIAEHDPTTAARLAAKLGLPSLKLGTSLESKYVMFKLRDRKFHPEVGVSDTGWVYGVGYDFSPRYSLDIFQRKNFDFRGKPRIDIGLSVRI